jgi:predicted nucleic acid-binding protein
MGTRAARDGAFGCPPVALASPTLSRSLLDAGVFIAAARDDRHVAALLKAIAGKSMVYVASHTVAEFYREGAATAKQGLLARQWRVEYVPITQADGQLAGTLLGRAGGNNTMDALLVAIASRGRFNDVFTSDPDDLERLRSHLKSTEWRAFAIVDIR